MSRFRNIEWLERAFPNHAGGGNSRQTELLFRIAQGMAADPTWSLCSDQEWADKVIKRTETLIKRIQTT